MRQVIAAFERTAQVVDVVGSPTRNGKVKYDVTLSDGSTVATFNEALAREALGYKSSGQAVSVQIEQSQNGQYTNFDLKGFSPGGSIGSGVVPVGAPGLAGAVQVAPATPVNIPVTKPRDFDAEALGKTRHGQFLGALTFIGTLAQVGLLPEEVVQSRETLLNEVVAWADAGVFYANTGKSIARPAEVPTVEQITVEAPEVETTIDELVQTGVVQVGTSGLPWGAK